MDTISSSRVGNIVHSKKWMSVDTFRLTNGTIFNAKLALVTFVHVQLFMLFSYEDISRVICFWQDFNTFTKDKWKTLRWFYNVCICITYSVNILRHTDKRQPGCNVTRDRFDSEVRQSIGWSHDAVADLSIGCAGIITVHSSHL